MSSIQHKYDLHPNINAKIAQARMDEKRRLLELTKSICDISLNKFKRIINAGWEGGIIYFSNNERFKEFKIGKAGGMGVVIPELSDALYKFGGDRDFQFNIVNISPFIPLASGAKNLDQLVKDRFLQYRETFFSIYDNERYTVEVYSGKTTFGEQFLLVSDAWNDLFGKNADPYGLTPAAVRINKAKFYPINIHNVTWALSPVEERAFVIFSQIVAKIYSSINADVAILNDYHCGLAGFYCNELLPVGIGHNFGYQGLMGLITKDGYIRKTAVEHLAIRLNLPVTTIENYFIAYKTHEYWGVGNMLQATLKLNRERTGISCTTVSPGYAGEIRQSRLDLMNRIQDHSDEDVFSAGYFSVNSIRKRMNRLFSTIGMKFGREEAKRFPLYVSNNDLEELQKYANVVGILNGLSVSKHARDLYILKQMVYAPESVEWRNPGETIPYIKREIQPQFPKGINFSHKTPIEEFTVIKKHLRRITLMEVFPDSPELWDDNERFIHMSVGRMTDQKNLELVISEAHHIVKERNELLIVIGSPLPGDRFYEKLEKQTTKLARNLDGFAFFALNSPLVRIYMGGSDLLHVTSRYEPCGLTDAEALWMGTLVVTHNVGGLKKGREASFSYEWHDTTDLEGERLTYRKTYS
ncbi:MAG: glycosyltransferase, partial [Oligoflexia bacterium]|nr:glycosyltransferase [Oligoflexia bacterium]